MGSALSLCGSSHDGAMSGGGEFSGEVETAARVHKRKGRKRGLEQGLTAMTTERLVRSGTVRSRRI